MCHVLVIEDEPFIAMQIESVLLNGGASSVDVAASEAEAIALATEHPPHFIASDVRLLEGTGPAAVEAIRRMLAVPVTFITAWPEACVPRRREDEVLTKPISAASLLDAFRRAVPTCAGL